MVTKRLFISVDMPHSVTKEVQRVQRFLKKEELFRGCYVDPSHVHITVKFLGDVKESLIPTIQERLRKIKRGPMHAHLGKLNLFKSEKSNTPRMIYLSVISPDLAEFARQIDDALADLFEPEKRSFVSHLTVARIKQIDDYDILKDLLDSFKIEPISFDIDSFALKESVLTSDGPVHTDILRYNLDA